jgi:hypothetical protein
MHEIAQAAFTLGRLSRVSVDWRRSKTIATADTGGSTMMPPYCKMSGSFFLCKIRVARKD